MNKMCTRSDDPRAAIEFDLEERPDPSALRWIADCPALLIRSTGYTFKLPRCWDPLWWGSSRRFKKKGKK